MESSNKDVIKLKLCGKFENFNFDLDLNLPNKNITAIFGRSGSGKTTLLRCIAGLERFKAGVVIIGNEVWQSEKQFVPTYQRDIGYVFQESSLLEHLSVSDNLNYGRRRSSKSASENEVKQIIELLGISHLLGNAVSQLSGGEKQRVAIARALMLKPALMLLDEPLASLDYQRKQEILSYLEKLPTEFSIPILYVSHSADEVTRLANYLVVMEEGRVKLQGEIHQVMASREISWLLSDEPFSLLFGEVSNANDAHGLTHVAVDDVSFLMPRQNVKEGQSIRLHLYAKDISLTRQRPTQTSILNIYSCTIQEISPATEDGQCYVHLQLAGSNVLARISRYSCEQLELIVGQLVFAQIKAVSIVQ